MTTGARVALRNDSYTLHLLLPTKVHGLYRSVVDMGTASQACTVAHQAGS